MTVTSQGKDAQMSENAQLNAIPKFVAFAVAVGLLPLAVYFLSKDYLWNGSTTYAAISAAAIANLLLFSYLFIAWKEDAAQELRQDKKAQ